MEKVFVVKRAASKLHATEAAIDAAMVQVSEMMAELVQTRKDLKLSAVVGSVATAKVAAAMAALSEARSSMIEAHADMDEVRLRIGVRTKMVGWDLKTGEAAQVSDVRLSEAS
ncbi:MAG TPA: hypothetical protein VN157_04320 [Caulobacter sp.]|nr:hypothetical protein [Caulobacter sp.]